MPSYLNRTSRIPSSPRPTHSAISKPLPNDIFEPILILLAGLVNTSQVSFSMFFRDILEKIKIAAISGDLISQFILFYRNAYFKMNKIATTNNTG